MTDVGVDGLWLDMNEPANFNSNYNWTVPNWVVAHGEGTPTTMKEVHNVYALGMAQATFEGMRAALPDQRPFLLTRAGYAGVQRYAATWTGDIPSTWAALQSTLPMMLNMGLSGNPFVGSDVGGWQGGADIGPELLARWMQLGAISPFYRNHTQKNAENQEPWAMGEEVEDISRNVISERYRLLPYWYALFEETTRTGAPILRPLVYEFQDDLTVRNLGDQAMLGPSLMIAPVMEPGASERTIYFPEGRWYEYRSAAIYEGPGMATVNLKLGALPMFAREGAIIPRTVNMQWTSQKDWAPIYFDLFPGFEPSSFTLYEDDGLTMAYRDGAYAKTPISIKPNEKGLSLTIGERAGTFLPPERQLIFHIHRVDHEPTGIAWEGETLSLNGMPGPAPGEPAVVYHPERRMLNVNITDGAPGTLIVEYNQEIEENAPPILKYFQVQAPASTSEDETIHITLSSNDWLHQPLEWMAFMPGFAAGWIEVPRGSWFEYKYTRGDWDTVEKYADCSEAANRYAFGGFPFLKQDEIAQWIDACP
jgi:alpha-glucosidase